MKKELDGIVYVLRPQTEEELHGHPCKGCIAHVKRDFDLCHRLFSCIDENVDYVWEQKTT